jgi:hypothetical protein
MLRFLGFKTKNFCTSPPPPPRERVFTLRILVMCFLKRWLCIYIYPHSVFNYLDLWHVDGRILLKYIFERLDGGGTD